MRTDSDDARTVINHNPLPEITHEDFVSLLGPMLAPENYNQALPNHPYPSPMPTSGSPLHAQGKTLAQQQQAARSPAPFDWLHFEGRSVKTTLSNMHGVDGLARERRWRSHCVFSLDVGRKARQGVEAVCVSSLSLRFHSKRPHATFPYYESALIPLCDIRTVDSSRGRALPE
jgi:hypothetical protein